jgi:capsular polysaccharide biosynthesis protein
MDRYYNNDGQHEVNLLELFNELKRNIWFILLFSLVFLFVGYVFTKYMVEPTYQSSASVMVMVEDETSGEYDYLNAARLLDSVAELMTMDVVLERVSESLNLGLEGAELASIRSKLSVQSSETAFFVTVSYDSNDKYMTKDIVNSIIDETIYITTTSEEVPFLVDKIKRVSYAYDGAYSSPNIILYMIVSMMIGTISSSGIVILFMLLRNTITSKEEIITELGLELLGEIPEYTIKEIKV